MLKEPKTQQKVCNSQKMAMSIRSTSKSKVNQAPGGMVISTFESAIPVFKSPFSYLLNGIGVFTQEVHSMV